jgi:tRNA1(Val) A37 N6-methylase TrmN6
VLPKKTATSSLPKKWQPVPSAGTIFNLKIEIGSHHRNHRPAFAASILARTMKVPHRRNFLHLAAGAAALPAVSPVAMAQAYPARPITMIVPSIQI